MNIMFGFNRNMRVASSVVGQRDTSFASIRRPTRGTVLKEDTYASIRLVTSDNTPLTMVDGGSNRAIGTDGKPLDINNKRYTDIYSNFLIQSVQEDRAEKAQILETFGDAFVFLFGERARMLNVSGALLNTFDFNWKQEWMENYENSLRGTKCVENDAQVYLAYDNTLVGGYLMSTSMVNSSQEQNFVQFNFQMFVTSYTQIGDVGNPWADPGKNGYGGPWTYTSSFEDNSQYLLTHILEDKPLPNKDASFFEGIQDKLRVVESGIDNAKKFINGIVTDLTAAQNGDVIRVPYGFAGSLVFDNSEYTSAQLKAVAYKEYNQSLQGQSITYTTFSDNIDEFVGKSQQYGSSVTDTGLTYVGNLFPNVDKDKQNSELVAKATADWKAHGMTPPTDYNDQISSFLLKRGVGILTAGVTAAWQSGGILAGLSAAGNNAAFGSGTRIGAISAAVVNRDALGNEISGTVGSIETHLADILFGAKDTTAGSGGGGKKQLPASDSTVPQVVIPPRNPDKTRTITSAV